MKNIAVCLVVGGKDALIKRKLSFQKWAIGAQAEALVPSTMCGILFSRILYVLVILNSYGIYMAVFYSHLLGSVQVVCQKHFLIQIRKGSPVYKMCGGSNNKVVWGPPVLYCDD